MMQPIKQRIISNQPKSDANRGLAGFTLVEILVLLAVFGIIAALAMPAIQTMLARARLDTAVRQTASVLYSARFHAIRHGATVRVELEEDGDQKRVWASLDRNRNGDFETDIGNVQLGRTLHFTGPPSDADAVDGFAVDRAVFRSDGTVDLPGAFRISGNIGSTTEYYEVRVAPAAAPRVHIRQWDPDLSKWVEEEADQ